MRSNGRWPTHTLVDTDPKIVADLLAAYKGHLAFDVGANAGQVSRVLMKNFFHVVAYEPAWESFSELKKLPLAVTTKQLALSSQRGPVALIEADKAIETGQLVTGDSLAFSWGPSRSTRQVEASTLDYEAARWGLPDFIKIDTEGHEVEVIKGGLELFEMHQPKLLIEVHSQENGPAIRKLLPQYHWDHLVHPYYPLGSVGRANHYWLRSA